MTLKLGLLAPHDNTLQKCVYCPKLSRASCPVSHVEASETLTPWGKMSLAYFAARGNVTIDDDIAKTAWACSACYACRERCEHHNEVATVLSDARAEMWRLGHAPPAVRDMGERFARLEREARAAAEALPSDPESKTAVLIGCSYLRHHPAVAAEALSVLDRLGVRGRLASGCCGLPLLHAGDRDGFVAAAARMADELRGAERVVVVDPGCAQALHGEYPRHGVATPEVVPLVDVLYANLERLPRLALEGERLRYHDPCQLGRGLGRYEEPRAVLARLTGEVPGELTRSRGEAECSGAGGLLPLTYPEASRAIAEERIEEHGALGGGTLVTACAQSLRRMGRHGEVVDLVTLVARALRAAP